MRRVLFFLVGVLVACRKESVPSAGAPTDAVATAAASAAASGATHAVLAARCHATEQGISLDDGGGLDDLEVGDGVAYADGHAVALVHRTQGGRLGAVALLRDDLGVARVVDFAPTLDEAPPPRLASCRENLVAAAFVVSDAGTRGRAGLDVNADLALYVVDQRVPAQPFLSIPQHRDDSLAIDLACSGGTGLAVWDETTAVSPANGARGVVRAAVFEVGQRAVRLANLSPPDSDAEMPRVVSNGAGFFVLWLARQKEDVGDSGAAASKYGRDPSAPTDIEAPGEPRAYVWLEMIEVDAVGNASGPVRRLTPTSGHISAYDVQAHMGKPKEGILVVARDDGEAVDGSGGVLLRVRARADGAEGPVTLPTDGLGRGAPTLVDAPAQWLVWVGPREQLRLLPLDPAGGVAAPASAEEGLDEARPLLSLAADGRMLVAAPKDKAAQLRVFSCQR